MTPVEASELFTKNRLEELFPATTADNFFEALYGDADEGAYDISLEYAGINNNTLGFEFHLKQRPGKCLACNLTYGLPTVFSRHPIINLDGIAKKINHLLGEQDTCVGWQVGNTKEINRELHVLPISFQLT